MFTNRRITLILMTAWLAAAVGCHGKKHPAPPPPPPTTGPTSTASNGTDNTGGGALGGKPTIAQFSAEPTTIQRGQASTLRWEVSGNATSVTIDQTIGTVQNSGVRRVFPSDSTTYTLTATGPGGATTSQATVSVIAPIAPPPPPPDNTGMGAGGTLPSMLSSLQDVYFDYDKSDVGGEAQSVLAQNASVLKGIFSSFPNANITIEGHCDERGSAEYNLGLGDRRASSVKDYLVQLGLPADKLNTISYGKERPQCTDQNEACWQKNRRAHFASGQ